MVALIQTTITTVLGPLVSELTSSRQTIERQAEEIAGLREDRGRLTAENAALRAAQTLPASNLTLEPSAPAGAPVLLLTSLRSPSLLALLVALVIVAGTLLRGWPW
jgi:hypothetical protein